MSAIDNVVEHFEKKYEVRSFEVPEWNLTIYVSNITARQMAKLHTMIKMKGEIEAFVSLIIDKALDKEGKRLFCPEDKMKMLNKGDFDLIQDVAVKILNLCRGKDADDPLMEMSDKEVMDEIKKN